MKPAALTVSVSAAVIAKPQPRGVSLQAAWKTTTTKETFGQDRNSILCWFILLPLSSLLLIPSCALPFLPHPHLFPFISMLAMLLLLVPLIPTFPMYSQFFPPHPTSIFFYLPPPLSALHFLSPFLPPLVSPAIWQPSSRSPLRIFTRAVLPTIRTHYCQLCHLRPPERQKKRRGGGGTVPVEVGLMCMWWGGRVLYSILDTTTKHSV